MRKRARNFARRRSTLYALRGGAVRNIDLMRVRPAIASPNRRHRPWTSIQTWNLCPPTQRQPSGPRPRHRRAAPSARPHPVQPITEPRKVDFRLANVNTVERSSTRHVGHSRARHERLGRGTSMVDARAADSAAFQHGNRIAGWNQLAKESAESLASANDDVIELLHGEAFRRGARRRWAKRRQ